MIAAWALLAACAPTRALAPLDPGQGAFTASLGGPVVEVFGGPLPLPVTSVGYLRGVGHQANVHATVYPTNLALFGVFGFDLGASRQLVAPAGARPRVMGDLTAYTFFGGLAPEAPAGGLRVAPDLSFIASWPIGPGDDPRHTPYLGVDLLTIPYPGPSATPSAVLGYEGRVSRRVGVQLEAKWIAPYAGTDDFALHWYAPGLHGALSAQLGLTVYGPRRAP